MSQNPNDMNIVVLIKAHYSSLRTSEKKIADYILENLDEVIYMNITALAASVSVSETSVIRLCKSLGFSGYHDFKISLARQVSVPRESQAEDITKYDDTDTVISKVMNSNMDAVRETMQFLDADKVDRAIRLIAGTKRLEFYGVGGSGAVAMDAQNNFFKYIKGACIAYTDSHMQAMSAATMGPGDVVIAISHSGQTKDIADSIRIARAQGASVISITGSVSNEVSDNSDIAFQSVSLDQYYRPGLMSSRLGALSILDCLATGVAFWDPERTSDVMEKTQAAIRPKKY